MQEHIRRAHPEHYIPKLPATEESFNLMISTPPSSDRSTQSQPGSAATPQALSRDGRPVPATADHAKGYPRERHSYRRDDSSAPATPRNHEEYSGGSLLPAASAAAALAQLHNHKTEPEWDSEGVMPPLCLAPNFFFLFISIFYVIFRVR